MNLPQIRIMALAACVLVLAACGSPTPPDSDDVPDFADTLRPQIEQALEDNVIPGAVVLIEKGGEGRWVHAFGTAALGTEDSPGADDRFRVGSNTKTMTGTVILQLAEEGRIGLEDPVSMHYSGVPDGDSITITHLLEMRSGLPDYLVDLDPTREPQRIWQPEELLALAFAHPVGFEPGTQFEYSNTNYILLGLIIEEITGAAAPEVFRERIFEPLGLADTSLPAHSDNRLPDPRAHGYIFVIDGAVLDEIVWTADQRAAAFSGSLLPDDATDWNPSWGWTAGSAISTAGDMAVYVRALVAGGLLDDDSQRLRLDSVQPIDPSIPDGTGYGLGLARIPPGLLGHQGQIPGYMSLATYDPDIELLVVILTNLTETPDHTLPAMDLLQPIVALFYTD